MAWLVLYMAGCTNVSTQMTQVHMPRCSYNLTSGHSCCSPSPQGDELVAGDVFYFDYGVIVCWGLSQAAEREVIRSLAGPALVDPLSTQEVRAPRCRRVALVHAE